MVNYISVFATVLLLHAGYSSYEYTNFVKTHRSSIPFPNDIALEVGLSMLLYLVSVLLLPRGNKELSLVDDGRVVSRGLLRPILMRDAVVEDEIKGANVMFKPVETRVGFIDILRLRREFAAWEEEQEGARESAGESGSAGESDNTEKSGSAEKSDNTEKSSITGEPQEKSDTKTKANGPHKKKT
ncbi:unnamed protein product [Cyberlindnera jadinii]|uniref:Uncharacterized protein n=1 Tax=Cyberlindnera jadinii (strain ATCC 18201 / CBS 1600 / BCRC 20928 / JCM 3617 / NBRC 0987 / NRRL Y-1542) TaxID=983966 RepID=A0A0H5CIH9_CYBJN|nr:unnamed protein product [Cyberlindnera jadinii]